MLIAILAVFLITVTALSAHLWPVWMDEVLLTDPAANLFLGHGFTSSAWYYQPRDEFWACNAPLYALLLFVWLKLFGLHITTTRLFNYLFISLAIGLIWWSVKRLKLVATMRDRFILLGLILLSYGVSFNYLSGRYDCLAIVLFSALLLAYTFAPSLPRTIALIGIGFFIPLSGFHLVPYVAILAAMLFPFLGKPMLKPFVQVVVGITLGLIAAVALYSSYGVLDTFIETVGGHTLSGLNIVPDSAKDASVTQKMLFVLMNIIPILEERFRGIVTWYVQDGSFLLLMGAAIALAFIQRSNRQFQWRSPLGFGLLAGLAVPLVMGLLRNYPEYYAWMAIIPLSIGIGSTLAGFQHSLLRRSGSLVVVILLLASGVPGLPRYLVPSLWHWQDRNYERVEQFVQAHISPQEFVYSDFAPYYAIRKRVETVLFPTYLDVMTDEEKSEVSTLILDLGQRHENYQNIGLFDRLGGDWYETNAVLNTSQFELRIFRRQSAISDGKMPLLSHRERLPS
ncbi:hypothetical protein ACQ4M4_09530 [Leptolyngbya sp. AN02str]|uniref:hypothetical protein n=1 Tax=Leptolyngbya sp. AN02str TaxID=3423363 RepID=UPI003D31CE53